MNSNCYLVYDNKGRCIVIDPGSEKSEREIDFINRNALILDYIIITHEHTDHNWGVNALRSKYPDSRLVCSLECSNRMNRSNKKYFLNYYDNKDYIYIIQEPEITINVDHKQIQWSDYTIDVIFTPGHSFGSMCIKIKNMLFTGDTIMPNKPYFNGRDSSRNDWSESVKKLQQIIPLDTIICPGHGDSLTFKEWLNNYM